MFRELVFQNVTYFCLQLELILNFSKIPHLAKRLKKKKVLMQTFKGEEEKLLMDLLCAMQPQVVKATRPNIYDQEHTIMNNACYRRTVQRIHGPVSSNRTSSDAQWLIIHFGTVLIPLACVGAVV